jgi:phospholipid/cholesterol/gamma-HCH transport system substrate-binding protein
LAELAIKPTTGQRLRSLVVIAIAIALTTTLAFLLIGGGGDLLARRTTITTYMPDGTGLAGYSVVRVNGIPIGKVSSFGISGLLDPQRAVKVEMRVVTRFLKNIPIDSQTNLGKDTLVGYPFIDIDLGKSRITLPENGVLQSESVQEAYIRADQMRAMEGTFQQIADLLGQVASPDTDIGRFITGSDEYDHINQEVADFDRGVRALITPRSSLGQAFYTSEVYDSIHRRVLDADQALESIQSGNGQMGRLLVDSSQYANAVQKLTDLRQTLADINSGKGKFGQLVADDQTWRSITKMLASTDAMLASLNAGEGRAGELLLSPQLYESLNGALRELQAALKDVHGNPKKYLRYKVF